MKGKERFPFAQANGDSANSLVREELDCMMLVVLSNMQFTKRY